MLLSNRALCLHRLGRLEEALMDAQKCASLRPDFFKGFLRAGLVLRELDRPQEALDTLRRSPKHDEIEKLSAQLRPEAEAAEARRIAGLDGAERRK
jgi:stress-induced-phosphoprotein 1